MRQKKPLDDDVYCRSVTNRKVGAKSVDSIFLRKKREDLAGEIKILRLD